MSYFTLSYFMTKWQWHLPDPLWRLHNVGNPFGTRLCLPHGRGCSNPEFLKRESTPPWMYRRGDWVQICTRKWVQFCASLLHAIPKDTSSRLTRYDARVPRNSSLKGWAIALWHCTHAGYSTLVVLVISTYGLITGLQTYDDKGSTVRLHFAYKAVHNKDTLHIKHWLI